MSDTPPFISKHQIAHHEAGHAVIAWFCNHEVINVTIRPDEEAGTLGIMWHNETGMSDLFAQFKLVQNPNAPDEWLFITSETTARSLTSEEKRWMELCEEFMEIDALERDLLVAAAGEQSERKLVTVTVEPLRSKQDWDNVSESVEILAANRKMAPSVVRAEAADRVASLLNEALIWRAVENVANALLKADSETLSGNDAVKLIRKVFTDEWDW